MIRPADKDDVDRFAEIINQQFGLQIEEPNRSSLSDVLARQLNVRGMSPDAYLRWLEAKRSARDIGELAQELTVTETYFFRHDEQFRALAQVALPERMAAHPTSKTLNLLSAACASGEEAYSLAMVALETVVDQAWVTRVRAVDLNPRMLERAKKARYSAWSLRETSPERRAAWFRADGADWLLDRRASTPVEFAQANIATDDPAIWVSGYYDVIFCRNVLMYFSPDQARMVVDRIAGSLAPGGYLFLGYAETLRGLSEDFHLRHSEDAFYYQKKEVARNGPPASRPKPAKATPPPAMQPPPSTAAGLDSTWVSAIGAANARIATLAQMSTARGQSRGGELAAAEAAVAATIDIGVAFDLMRQEKYTEALASVCSLKPRSRDDPDVMLLEAMLLTHGGRFAEAGEVCSRIHLIDELNAGAHYAKALCREGLGDLAGAAEHHRLAAYLDPTFAMPRLHLGMLARRAGDREAARRELGRALNLLKAEEASRLLLFGGSFSREALIALCEQALRASGAGR